MSYKKANQIQTYLQLFRVPSYDFRFASLIKTLARSGSIGFFISPFLIQVATDTPSKYCISSWMLSPVAPPPRKMGVSFTLSLASLTIRMLSSTDLPDINRPSANASWTVSYTHLMASSAIHAMVSWVGPYSIPPGIRRWVIPVANMAQIFTCLLQS